MAKEKLRQLIAEYEEQSGWSNNTGRCCLVLMYLERIGLTEFAMLLAKGNYREAYELVDKLNMNGGKLL